MSRLGSAPGVLLGGTSIRGRVPMRCRLTFAGLLISAFLVPWSPVYSQSRAALQGRVVDSTGAVMVRITITVRNRATNLERSVQTDGEGNYQVAALPVGT